MTLLALSSGDLAARWIIESPGSESEWRVFTVSPALSALLHRPSLSAVSRLTRLPGLDTRNQHDPRNMRTENTHTDYDYN